MEGLKFVENMVKTVVLGRKMSKNANKICAEILISAKR